MMPVSQRWAALSAELLDELDADRARVLLGEGLARELHAAIVVRTSLGPDGHLRSARWLAGPPPDPATETAARAMVLSHPLVAHLHATGASRPTTLLDAVSHGSPVPRTVHGLIERMGMTLHQLAVPVRPGTAAGSDAYGIVSAEPLGRGAVERATQIQRLVAGLDSHITMLERLGRLTPLREPAVRLTPRERIVLGEVAAGSTVAGTALRLGISPRTVHKHQENLYRKLGARDRLSAVLAAQDLGLLQPGPSSDARTSSGHPGREGS